MLKGVVADLRIKNFELGIKVFRGRGPLLSLIYMLVYTLGQTCGAGASFLGQCGSFDQGERPVPEKVQAYRNCSASVLKL